MRNQGRTIALDPRCETDPRCEYEQRAGSTTLSLKQLANGAHAPCANDRFAKAKSSEVVAKEVAKRRISAPSVAPSRPAKADVAIPDAAPDSAKGENR